MFARIFCSYSTEADETDWNHPLPWTGNIHICAEHLLTVLTFCCTCEQKQLFLQRIIDAVWKMSLSQWWPPVSPNNASASGANISLQRTPKSKWPISIMIWIIPYYVIGQKVILQDTQSAKTQRKLLPGLLVLFASVLNELDANNVGQISKKIT